jgi:GNAT superfamily N-acetyltransferase
MEDNSLIADEEWPAVRANDRIHLRFYEEKEDYGTVVNPTFTHQLFEDEKVVLKSGINAYINISLRDLHSDIECRDTDSQEDRDAICSKVSDTLVQSPSDSTLPPLPAHCLIDTFTIDRDEYFIYLVNHKDENAMDIFCKAEQLAIWFIETASPIDFTDDKWEALFLLRKSSENASSTPFVFVGYYTLFTFHNPVRGSKMRVCQALILPPYQGRGLGRQMLLQVYRVAAERESVVEVTVEDPAPGFQRLRDAVDVEWVLLLTAQQTHTKSTSGSEAMVKLTPAQQKFVHHCTEYRTLFFQKKSVASDCMVEAAASASVEAGSSGGGGEGCVGVKRPLSPTTTRATNTYTAPDASTRETCCNAVAPVAQPPSLKTFRLAVKKHLLATNGDLKGLCKADMQKELGELYAEMESRFKSVCRKEWAWMSAPCSS